MKYDIVVASKLADFIITVTGKTEMNFANSFVTILFFYSESPSESTSIASPSSIRIPSAPPYGGLSLNHLPQSTSIRQRPDAVPAANKLEDANPFPLFQTTR